MAPISTSQYMKKRGENEILKVNGVKYEKKLKTV